jgi:hypothetical protein
MVPFQPLFSLFSLVGSTKRGEDCFARRILRGFGRQPFILSVEEQPQKFDCLLECLHLAVESLRWLANQSKEFPRPGQVQAQLPFVQRHCINMEDVLFL